VFSYVAHIAVLCWINDATNSGGLPEEQSAIKAGAHTEFFIEGVGGPPWGYRKFAFDFKNCVTSIMSQVQLLHNTVYNCSYIHAYKTIRSVAHSSNLNRQV